MKESEAKLSAAEKKERIRQRYKGVDIEDLDVIPAAKVENFYEDTREKRVAVYARVSTDDPRQTSSYELQKNHYQDVVAHHPGWNLINIYADEGISGTSLQHRDAFIKMIEDCKAGKIDLIVTKSVSRFARNVLDCIGYVRELAAMQPPIGVFFETENIYTLNPNSEMSLSFISTLAQEESHNKSEIMNASIEMRFRRGIFLTPALLGYDKDEDGILIINEEEAKTVRLIFFMYMYGYTCTQIAETLEELGRKTKKGNTKWSPSTVLNVLQNERHCGDVLARKTWTPNYLNHKSKKNNKDRTQYRQRDHHEAIISREDFIAVQHLISNAKYRNKEILPRIKVINGGALLGFIIINPRWSGFDSTDYINASNSVYDDAIELEEVLSEEIQVEANDGDFDFRGFEVARSQFFETQNKVCVTFSNKSLIFSTAAIRKLNNSEYVELLLHPTKKQLVVRSATANSSNSIKWAKFCNDTYFNTTVSGSAFLPHLFSLFNWDINKKYRVRGIRKTNETESVLVFDMSEVEIFIQNVEDINAPLDIETVKPLITTPRTICAFPEEWINNFGNEYYRQAQAIEMANFAKTGKWNVTLEGQPFETQNIQITSPNIIKTNIQNIISEMKGDVING